MRSLLRILILLSIVVASASSQVRIAVFPFTNMDGNGAYNQWCFKIQDSLVKEFVKADPEAKYYQVVPKDSVEMAFARLKLNPLSPEFSTEMWKAVDQLKVTRVVLGSFNLEFKKFLINAYLYHVDNQLPDPDFQALNIFKKEEVVYEAVPAIVKQLKKAFVK